jgi:hypothetical protein
MKMQNNTTTKTMENKQTAIEWLVEKIQQANPSFKFDALIRQAKQMEKKSSTNSSIIKTLKAENEALKSDIFHLEETIRLQKETIATLTQMKVAPKKEQSIFFDLLEHLNIVKK